jgi:hypothetical protein
LGGCKNINIRYFFRDVHFSEILQKGVCLQATVKGFSELHGKILHLLEVPDRTYINLKDNWWQFEGT